MKNFLNLILQLQFLLISCEPSPPYNNKKDLVGNWECKNVRITTSNKNISFFDMSKYGYASLVLSKDTTYTFSMVIMKDVVIDKEVFGNLYSKKIINAGFKNLRKGSYSTSEKTMIFYDDNKTVVSEENYHFENRTLVSRYLDKEKKIWEVSWEKVN
ncbi:MAG: hypothetical protein C4517_00675 [Stygiobacter sp.]|nr:MAG: hypothetical protein C4517_00675 [Stygiobacter sp.]